MAKHKHEQKLSFSGRPNPKPGNYTVKIGRLLESKRGGFSFEVEVLETSDPENLPLGSSGKLILPWPSDV